MLKTTKNGNGTRRDQDTSMYSRSPSTSDNCSHGDLGVHSSRSSSVSSMSITPRSANEKSPRNGNTRNRHSRSPSASGRGSERGQGLQSHHSQSVNSMAVIDRSASDNESSRGNSRNDRNNSRSPSASGRGSERGQILQSHHSQSVNSMAFIDRSARDNESPRGNTRNDRYNSRGRPSASGRGSERGQGLQSHHIQSVNSMAVLERSASENEAPRNDRYNRSPSARGRGYQRDHRLRSSYSPSLSSMCVIDRSANGTKVPSVFKTPTDSRSCQNELQSRNNVGQALSATPSGNDSGQLRLGELS